ncbi:hypothetical protein Zmor_013949 [Zophobas morio]|uniref:ITPR-interacting domain-containing protein n=2 Tax=Zophobas morio TaxID=2755281 RepID=A0AA38MG74_9CUCU|nr:hypothetical protein Zmor_013949 [Zophobas morio]
MSKSPITVQQWVESLPPPHTTSSFYSSPLRNTRRFIPREISLQSDDASSHCSSVESVLELRKPDPEAVLLGLGFGPPKGTNLVSKIPSRFLQPSKLLTQIDINKFLEQYGDTKCPNQHSAPPSPARSQSKSC